MTNTKKLISTLTCTAFLAVSMVSVSAPAQAGDLLGGLTKGLKYLNKKDKSKCLDDNPLIEKSAAGDAAKNCKKGTKDAGNLKKEADKTGKSDS